MFQLAWRSLRQRTGAFVASFLAMFLGAAILMSFASMLDTAAGANVDSASKETLSNMGTIVGGWGLLLVVFAVTSTLTMAVRQRAAETALLKSVGATPAQIGRMIVGETLMLAVVATLAAAPVGALGGSALLGLLKDTDQVAGGVDFAFAGTAIGMGFGITIVASVLAALLTTRRATRVRVAAAANEAEVETGRMGRARTIGGWVTLTVAGSLAVTTATVMHGKGSDAMQSAGSASVFASIALALFSPWLIRRVTALIAGPLERRGVVGHLAVSNLRRRTNRLASALMPIILFVGIGTGTFYLVDIDNAAVAAEGIAKTNEQRNIETLNFVVVGMVVLFACILLINTLVATVTHRRREFAQARLAGATSRQVLGVVAVESAVLTVSGVVFGSLAGLATILPFNYARTDTALPDVAPWIWLGFAAVAAAVTLVAALGTARRNVRGQAIEAIAA
ncbi:FtsX-like permease family protein [Embleya sp. NBC_00896]|uniref:FtsX-like permease family protein n=1 Tax=Embleya sp. NBC_00896 TaxID=2975961 RepID=UPI003870B1DF|nr:FtsX-like permease family protein [Embleya sp. NBC_00896]